MASDIKPCPFCGEMPLHEPHSNPTYPQVECWNIECPIGMVTDLISLEAWNRRAAPQPDTVGGMRVKHCICLFDDSGNPLRECLYHEQWRANTVEHLDWSAINDRVDDYIEGYEFRGDFGDYLPTDEERFLIKDAVTGLLHEIQSMAYTTTKPTTGGSTDDE